MKPKIIVPVLLSLVLIAISMVVLRTPCTWAPNPPESPQIEPVEPQGVVDGTSGGTADSTG